MTALFSFFFYLATALAETKSKYHHHSMLNDWFSNPLKIFRFFFLHKLKLKPSIDLKESNWWHLFKPRNLLHDFIIFSSFFFIITLFFWKPQGHDEEWKPKLTIAILQMKEKQWYYTQFVSSTFLHKLKSIRAPDISGQVIQLSWSCRCSCNAYKYHQHVVFEIHHVNILLCPSMAWHRMS